MGAFISQMFSIVLFITRRLIFSVPEFIIISFLGFAYSICSWWFSLRLDRKVLKKELIGKHVIVVGGTTGLGLSLCRELSASGANISIIARGTKKDEEDPLEMARQECLKFKLFDSQEFTCVKADASIYEKLLSALETVYETLGSPFWVINCAGVALPGYLRDQLPQQNSSKVPEAESQISSNYYTSLNLTRAVLFLANRKPQLSSTDGYPSKLVFMGSILSVMSFVGYSAYAASKYALKGLSDTLRSELLPFGVKVHICILGNINTNSFKIENELKPIVTKNIEGKSNPESPKNVATCVLAGLLNDRYCITNEFIGEVFRMANNGVAPRPNYISEVIV